MIRSRIVVRLEVLWALYASSLPMGQQRYEEEIQNAMARRADSGAWTFRRLVLRGLRSALPGDRRFPEHATHAASIDAARGIGLMTYRTRSLVHRFDLRLPPGPLREILTVHDIAPLHFDDEGLLPRHAPAAIRRAAAIICPSAFSAEELSERFGVQRVHVVPNGIIPDRLSRLAARSAAPPWLPGRHAYVLHSGGSTARKNLASLADAWLQLVKQWPDLHLVLCGPPDPRRDRLFLDLPRVVIAGRVGDGQLAWLMRNAAAVVIPSTYEGFGLPALEAMALGTPVVAAHAAALPEVCGEAAELAIPTGEGLANGIDRILRDTEWSNVLRSRGLERAARYTWDDAALRHLSVYEEVLSS